MITIIKTRRITALCDQELTYKIDDTLWESLTTDATDEEALMSAVEKFNMAPLDVHTTVDEILMVHEDTIDEVF